MAKIASVHHGRSQSVIVMKKSHRVFAKAERHFGVLGK